MPVSRQRISLGIIGVFAVVTGLIWTFRENLPIPGFSSVSPLATPQRSSLASLDVVASATPVGFSPLATAEPTSTPIALSPKILGEPTGTDPPFPTAVPTPAVTPLPTITPPYLEGLGPQPTQPYWIYWAQGDEIWRIDNEGDAPELVVDTFAATGNHLVGDAPDGEGSDCCYIGPYFTVAPDQQKLALVVNDQAAIDAKYKSCPHSSLLPRSDFVPVSYLAGSCEPLYGAYLATFLYDMADHSVIPLGSVRNPRWSPDSKQVAFFQDGGLWIANSVTGKESARIQLKQERGWLDAAWSPDSTQLAFMYSQYTESPSIWVVNLTDGSEPKVVMRIGHSESLLALKWSPDGNALYYLSPEGSRDPVYIHVQNLWKVSLLDDVPQPVTTDMMVGNYGFLPGQPWIYITGYHIYDNAADAYTHSDVWLFNSNDGETRRLTGGETDWYPFTLTPDGANLLGVARLGDADSAYRLQQLSLADGSFTSLDERIGNYFLYGGAK